MSEIRVLDSHVADLIAAGEVVERPASVVKELLENAIDAGADSVTVEIQNGGMALVRVTDNGCGIPDGEAETAFLRHATSKIRGEYDLEAIGTLGFRGEALAAIAAVSRIELLTKTAGAPMGTAVSLEGGIVTDHREAGCPNGTTILVKDLFYNTPARLKFVKRDTAEGAAAFAAAQRVALSHPEVSIKFLRDGKQELLTPGDGALRSAMYAVLGRDLALGLIPVNGSGEELSVEGFTSLPSCCRGTRGSQFFFVNGRFIRSRTMTAAVEEAYRNQKMVGKFPACVLHLNAKLSAVDVNVHPTKQEVKFSSERKVFDAVYYAVLSALEGDRTPVRAKLDAAPPRQDTVTPNQTAFRTMTAAEYRSAGTAKMPPQRPAVSRPGTLPLHDFTRPSTPPPAQIPPPRPVERAPEAAEPVRTQAPPVPPRPVQPEPEPVSAPLPPREEPVPWRVAGELFHTYIVVEQGERALLIDKHAAHERINFDRLKAEGYRPMVQELLAPVVLNPGAEESAALLAHLPLLREFGFDAEDFGGGAIIVRAAPGDVSAGDLEATLAEIAGKLLTTGRADPDAARDDLLHTMACKAAIKGGQKNDPAELERVARAVIAGEVKYCPHGRPVAIELTRAQLEKQFKR